MAFRRNNSHKNHPIAPFHANDSNKKSSHTHIMRTDIFIVINQ